jgi:hypothetical protein
VGVHTRLGKELHHLLRSWESNLLTHGLPNKLFDFIEEPVLQPLQQNQQKITQSTLVVQYGAIIAAPSKQSEKPVITQPEESQDNCLIL